MILRVVIFCVLLFGTVLFDREFIQPRKIGAGISALAHCILLLGAYLILLYLEIRKRIAKATQKQLRWTGFHFTFWAGFFWGGFFISRGWHSWFESISNLLVLLLNLAGFGLIFGLVGMAITQFMLLWLFKLPDQP